MSEHLELKEAEAARWLTADQLDEVKWLPADMELIVPIRQALKSRYANKEEKILW